MRENTRLMLDERYLDRLAGDFSAADLELPDWKELPDSEERGLLESWMDVEEPMGKRTARRQVEDLFEDVREFADWDS